MIEDGKICSRCKIFKDRSNFSKRKEGNGMRSECKECAKNAPNKKEYMKAYRLRTRYHLSVEKYNTMIAEQLGCCAICGKSEELFIDHNHSCCPGEITCGKCVRALLCRNCNAGIGYFEDEIEKLESAILYLKKYG